MLVVRATASDVTTKMITVVALVPTARARIEKVRSNESSPPSDAKNLRNGRPRSDASDLSVVRNDGTRRQFDDSIRVHRHIWIVRHHDDAATALTAVAS